jgi:hypothetical protein
MLAPAVMRFAFTRARSWVLSALVLVGAPLGCGHALPEPPDWVSNGDFLDGGVGGSQDIAHPCSEWINTYCPCPAGPVGGIDVGNSLPWMITWGGYPDNSETLTDIPLSDYSDCDGSLGINALLVVFASESCADCAIQADAVAANLPTWSSLGIEVLTAIVYDPSVGPVTSDSVLDWKKKHNLTASTVVLAAKGPMPPSVPYMLLVDPRTLLIVQTGNFDFGNVVQLAKQNMKP